MAIEGSCDVHDWSWDPIDDYGCPVCYGISLEQGRIIELLDNIDWFEKELVVTLGHEMTEDGTTETAIDLPAIFALIKGESNA